MPVDRDKITRNALRLTQKGQFSKAIEEYRKLLSVDPGDIRTRLKLLDLYGRAGRKKEAIEECSEVAESYADQGFYLKAIAVYKQALRIDPDNHTLYQDMGEMYVKQGLVGDALGAYKKGVEILRRAGQAEEAEALLVRMEEMAPENAAIKVHLGELYLETERFEDFEEILAELIAQLRGEGRTRKLLQTVESFYEQSNRHPAVLQRLAELYVELGEVERAMEVIRAGLEAQPTSRDLQLLGLRAHLHAGQLEEARRVALVLHGEAPDDVHIVEQLVAIAQARGDGEDLAAAYRAMAKAYARSGSPQKEALYYRKLAELLPDDAEARLALGEVIPLEEPRETEYQPEAGVGSQWEVSRGEEPTENVAVDEGLAEAELYLKYGMEEKAAAQLAELSRRAPDHLDIHTRLRDLFQRRGDREGWARQQLLIAELFARGGRETEALRAYETILEDDPENSDAREGIQSLRQMAASTRSAAGGGSGSAAVDTLQQDAPGRGGSTEGKEEPPGEAFVDLQGEILDEAVISLGSDFEGFQDFEVSELDDIVSEFKTGIAEQLDAEDFDTHYSLGIAYRDMGLLDDAVGEFQIAARSPDKAREAYSSMAMVYQELGKLKEARTVLQMALAGSRNSPEDRVAILFEIGSLAEQDGDWRAALSSYEKAAEVDPAHRDLGKRLERVRTRAEL